MKFEVIKIHGVSMGVGFIDRKPEGEYSTSICETLYDTGNDKKDAAESKKWAKIICELLNKHYKP